MGCPEGRSPFGSGFPIGASSTPVGKGSTQRGNGVPLGGRFPKEGNAFLGTLDFPLVKSSVLYLSGADSSWKCVVHPGKCGYNCGVLARKVAPTGLHERQEKAGRRCSYEV